MSREDLEAEEPALTPSLISQVFLEEFLPPGPEGLSLTFCIMVGVSVPQCPLGLALGSTGYTFPLLAKENAYFVTGPYFCRLTASSLRRLSLLDVQFWPVGDYDVKKQTNKQKLNLEKGGVITKKDDCNRKGSELRNLSISKNHIVKGFSFMG